MTQSSLFTQGKEGITKRSTTKDTNEDGSKTKGWNGGLRWRNEKYKVKRGWKEELGKNRGEQMDSSLSITPAVMCCCATSQVPYLFQA